MGDRTVLRCSRCNTRAFAAATKCWACNAELPDDNVCEHGDHPAPDGVRFCSDACALCEIGEVECGGCRLERPASPGRSEP